MNKKVLILGADGYLGWALTIYLLKRGYDVECIDDFSRRRRVREIGSDSLFPLVGGRKKIKAIRDFNITHYKWLKYFVRKKKPDVIVHLAEIPSAPYSMMKGSFAKLTQYNNVIGTLNILWIMREEARNAHLIKLGTMGEYSDWIYDNPNIEIPEESRIKVQYQMEDMTIPTPRWAGSFYHFSKIFDSYNIEFACNLWGLRATDLNQGVVYGTKTDEMERNEERTRFDYDDIFGTVVNRFLVQAAVDEPLTVYGEGGQTRGFININDSMKCIELAINNPPDKATFQVFNQITEVLSINEIAKMVQECADFDVKIKHLKNPRVEKEQHNYNPTYKKLTDLGLKPRLMSSVIGQMLEDVIKYKRRIKKDVIRPRVKWL